VLQSYRPGQGTKSSSGFQGRWSDGCSGPIHQSMTSRQSYVACPVTVANTVLYTSRGRVCHAVTLRSPVCRLLAPLYTSLEIQAEQEKRLQAARSRQV
jgi:hypothetical protein